MGYPPRTISFGGGPNGKRISFPAPRPPSAIELKYPSGFDKECAPCGYLNWLYGPHDEELIAHVSTHNYPDYTEEELFTSTTLSIETEDYTLKFIANINSYNDAGSTPID